MKISKGFCVKIPDGRIGRVREFNKQIGKWKIRVKRQTSNTHQFLYFYNYELTIVDCPKGWMSVTGYNNYLSITLKKMKQRQQLKQ